MTEREFDQKIEAVADRFERCVEASADRLDRSVTKKWNDSRLFRMGMKSLSLTVEAGLIAGAGYLADKGHRTAAAWCLGLGVLGLLCDIVTGVAWRRK